MIKQPDDLKKILYTHQLSNVYRMEKLEQNDVKINDKISIKTRLGFLSDKAGYGKTLCVISLLLRNKMVWDVDSFYNEQKYTTNFDSKYSEYISSSETYNKLDLSLIVTGPSIIEQWCNELSYSNLRYIKLLNINQIYAFLDNEEKYDVVITVPSMYNHITSLYNKYAWKRLIFDEPGLLYIKKMKHIVAGFYWFITATPYDIVYLYRNKRNNFITKIFSTVFSNFSFENTINYINIKNTNEILEQSIKLPQINYIYHKCYNPIYNNISKIVDSNILELIASGDISNAIKTLGGDITDNIVDLIRKNKNIELKTIELQIQIHELKNNEDKKNFYINQKNTIEQQLFSLDEKYKESQCPICLDTVVNPILEHNCQNIFCSRCLVEWYKTNNTCPLCRKIISIDKLIIEDKTFDDKKISNKKLISKETTCINIIKNNPLGKFIIFSPNDNTYTHIYSVLTGNDISFTKIKGSSSERTKQIDTYKTDAECSVIFLNSITNCAGINLQETTDIIIYQDISNENTIQQMIGRAMRIGRKEKLNVHYLTL